MTSMIYSFPAEYRSFTLPRKKNAVNKIGLSCSKSDIIELTFSPSRHTLDVQDLISIHIIRLHIRLCMYLTTARARDNLVDVHGIFWNRLCVFVNVQLRFIQKYEAWAQATLQKATMPKAKKKDSS